jgi:hypothetical protein
LAKRGERGRFGRSNGNDDESTGGLWKVNMRDIQYGRNQEYSRILFVKIVSFVCQVDGDIRRYRRIKEKKSFVERMGEKN